jgi:ABC-2 type transport system permease protein
VQIDFRGGSPLEMIWKAAPFADTWAATIVLLLALPLWLSPFIGWFLFVSAFTKRSPLLVAAMPIILLPMFERLFFDSKLLAEAFFLRSIQFPLFTGVDNMDLIFQEGEDLAKLAEEELSVFALLDLGNFLASPQLWLGIVVCGLFTAAAIYVRRYRDES